MENAKNNNANQYCNLSSAIFKKNFEQGDHGPLRIAYAIHQLNYSVLGFGKNDHKHIKRKLTCYLEYIQTSTPQHIAACFST